ncbi:hypothetical protein [Streptomyces sp. SP18CS02]|uniref:hypothetical protein n=1 Tax=Streptomyces sp. SP18CS02 TaxID=3002531 RepID=UPI002E7758AC|nr:hypothetical protein [Streptomyces sp. SP18CS02]MEE1754664.1 hypothetical protein [Streptomyces sp. SP18CS02]
MVLPDGRDGLAVVTWTLADGVPWTLYDLAERLRLRLRLAGTRLPAAPPGTRPWSSVWWYVTG